MPSEEKGVWYPSEVRAWMLSSAHKYGEKALGTKPPFARSKNGALLMETYGALRWAVENELGQASREDFEAYMVQACGWSEANILNAMKRIEQMSAEEDSRWGPRRASRSEAQLAKRDIAELKETSRPVAEYPSTEKVWQAFRDAEFEKSRPVTAEDMARLRATTIDAFWMKLWLAAASTLAAGVDTPIDLEMPHATSVDVRAKESPAARTVPMFVGEEPLSILAENLQARGKKISMLEIATWSVVKRDVARAWIEQGGEPPDFLTACAACDRGEAYVAGREYIHTGKGTLCAGSSAGVAAPIPDDPPAKAPLPSSPAAVARAWIIPCARCTGTGYDPDPSLAARQACSVCEGVGRAPEDTCPSCLGAGCNEAGDDCRSCEGSGRVSSDPISVEIVHTGPQHAGVLPIKRKRGRPPGSKNKVADGEVKDGSPLRRVVPLDRPPTPIAQASTEAPKRRGRPPGSKNKKVSEQAWDVVKVRAAEDVVP